MSLHLSPTEMNKVVRCQIEWQTWADENRCFWTQPVWKFRQQKNPKTSGLAMCSDWMLTTVMQPGRQVCLICHLWVAFRTRWFNFTIDTKFMKEDSIILTVNMLNLTYTVNSHQNRLFNRRPWWHSPDSFIKLLSFVSCCTNENYLNLWNTVNDKSLIIWTSL